jgi:hypothetical protein
VKRKTFCIIGSVAAYWALMFFGPALVMLFNNIGYYVSGSGYGPGSLMYTVIQFLSQPISVFLAYGAAKSICANIKTTSILINIVIAICVLVVLAFSGFVVGNALNAWQMVVSCAACIINAVQETKSIKNATDASEETALNKS